MAGAAGSVVVVVAGASGVVVVVVVDSVVVASVVPESLQAATEKRASADTEARTIFFMTCLLSAELARCFSAERSPHNVFTETWLRPSAHKIRLDAILYPRRSALARGIDGGAQRPSNACADLPDRLVSQPKINHDRQQGEAARGAGLRRRAATGNWATCFGGGMCRQRAD